MKRMSLLLVLVVGIGFANGASACEGCRTWSGGQVTCWSGLDKGAQLCYGGWGTPCYTEGQCEVPPVEGVAVSVLARSEQVCADGPLGCEATLDRERPAAGFVLETPSEVVAKRSVPL